MPSGGVGGGAFLRLNDYPSWPSTPQVGVRQDMPVVAGTSYTFTVWAKQGNPGGSDTAWGYVTWLSSGGSSITGYGVNGWLGTYSSAYSGYSVPGDDWTFIEWGLDAGTAPIVAPPGATSVAFYLCQYNVGGSLDFDNASIVPEPMTMALLGLGALMLRRRK